jgi:hypothetical protein
MKKKIIKQIIHTTNFLTQFCLELSINQLVHIAKGYMAYHCELKQVSDKPLSNQAYGYVAVYCYFSTLPAKHKFFTSYLFEEQDNLMKSFKKTSM